MSWLLYGFARSLKALARYCQSNKIDFYIWDDNPNTLKEAIEMGYKVANPIINNTIKVARLVITPGIHLKHAIPMWAKTQNIPIYNDISVFFEIRKNMQNIAVTGTFGKSTCVSLVHHITKLQLGGNIGNAVFNLDLHEPAIVELSAQQLDLCDALHCDIAAILNLYPQHLDWYADLKSYYQSKAKIFNNARLSICNYDNKAYFNTIHSLRTISTTSPLADYALINENLYENGQQIGTLKSSAANVSVVGAYAIVREYGLSTAEILDRLASFKGLSNRCETVVGGPDAALWIINDSKATNLLNTVYAIRQYWITFNKKVICIVGGKDTNQDLSILNEIFDCNPIFITTGATGSNINTYLTNHDMISFYKPELLDCIKLSLSLISADYTTILFSPGHPSTDQYKDFEHRGDVFKAAISSFQV